MDRKGTARDMQGILAAQAAGGQRERLPAGAWAQERLGPPTAAESRIRTAHSSSSASVAPFTSCPSRCERSHSKRSHSLSDVLG